MNNWNVGTENINELVENLTRIYHLNSKVSEVLKKKILNNMSNYGIGTADDYVSEIMQSIFEVLKEHMYYDDGFFRDFSNRIMQDFFQNRESVQIDETYVRNKRLELISIVDELASVAGCINEVQYSELNKYHDYINLNDFDSNEFKQEILNCFDNTFGKLSSGNITEAEVQDFYNEFKNVLEGNTGVQQYRLAIAQFKKFNGDTLESNGSVSYNTDLQKKLKEIDEIVAKVTKAISSIRRCNFESKLSEADLESLYQIQEILNGSPDYQTRSQQIEKYKGLFNKIWQEYLNDRNQELGEVRYLVHNVRTEGVL